MKENNLSDYNYEYENDNFRDSNHFPNINPEYEKHGNQNSDMNTNEKINESNYQMTHHHNDIERIVINYDQVQNMTRMGQNKESANEMRLTLFVLILLLIFNILYAIIMFIITATTIYSIVLFAISSITTAVTVCNVILIGWSFFNLNFLFKKNGHIFFIFSQFCMIIIFFVSWIVIILHSTQLSIMTIISNLTSNMQLLMVFHGIVFVFIFIAALLLIHLIMKQRK